MTKDKTPAPPQETPAPAPQAGVTHLKTTRIVYAGGCEQTEAKELVFPRLVPIEVDPAVAKGLVNAKPRCFFYEHEPIPEAVLDEWLTLPMWEMDHWKQHSRAYEVQGMQYTDEEDVEKREGCMGESQLADAKLEEARAMLEERKAGATPMEFARAKKRFEERKGQLKREHEQRLFKERQRAAKRKQRNLAQGLPEFLDLPIGDREGLEAI